jgi:hypothetical protein
MKIQRADSYVNAAMLPTIALSAHHHYQNHPNMIIKGIGTSDSARLNFTFAD